MPDKPRLEISRTVLNSEGNSPPGGIYCAVLENFKGRLILLCVTFFPKDGVFINCYGSYQEIVWRRCMVRVVWVTPPAHEESSHILKYKNAYNDPPETEDGISGQC